MTVLRWTEEQFQARQAAASRLKSALPVREITGVLSAPNGKKRHKYRAVKVEPAKPGTKPFDSRLEAREHAKLVQREQAGEICDLRRQVRFSLFAPGGEHLQIWTADFVFYEPDDKGVWRRVVADAKSRFTKTLRTWPKIKTLMQACHGIDVRELP